jgi:hypothetical protein
MGMISLRPPPKQNSDNTMRSHSSLAAFTVFVLLLGACQSLQSQPGTLADRKSLLNLSARDGTYYSKRLE